MLKDLNYLDNNAQIMPQQKENASDYKTNMWQKRSSSVHPTTQVNKCVKIRIIISKDVKIMTALLTGKQDGNGTKSSREACRILRLRRPHHVRIPHGKIGIHGGGILQNLTISSEWLFFTERAVSDCRNVVPTIRRCENTDYTPAACITHSAVFSRARTWNACLWLKSLTAQDVWVAASLCA